MIDINKLSDDMRIKITEDGKLTVTKSKKNKLLFLNGQKEIVKKAQEFKDKNLDEIDEKDFEKSIEMVEAQESYYMGLCGMIKENVQTYYNENNLSEKCDFDDFRSILGSEIFKEMMKWIKEQQEEQKSESEAGGK